MKITITRAAFATTIRGQKFADHIFIDIFKEKIVDAHASSASA